MLESLKERAHTLKVQTYALYIAVKDPRTPWYARLFALCVVAYAFSPIDLIPDFIPVLGYLDDLILIPIGIVIALRLIPAEVMRDSQEKAIIMTQDQPTSWVGAAVVIGMWLIIIGVFVVLML